MRIPWLVLGLGFVALSSHDGYAHGSIYRPPGITGGPGGPTTGGGNPGSATGGSGAATATPTSWEAWWAFNREPYLPRHSPGRSTPASDQTGFLTGRGRVPDTGATGTRLGLAEARRTVLPSLAAGLSDANADVVDSSIIALARVVPPEQSGPFIPMLRDMLRHRHRSAREAAILGLGVLGSETAGEFLRAILQDTPVGRQYLGNDAALNSFQRGLAALALGLLNQNESVVPLLKLAGAVDTPRELAAACVLALGQHSNAATTAGPGLVRLLVSRSLDREVKAQVPVALQRLPHSVARSALHRLTETMLSTEHHNGVRRSAAIALGRIASIEDKEVIDALVQVLTKDSDAMARHYACIALGRIGELADTASTANPRYGEIAEVLLRQLRRGKQKESRAFAAISLGLLLRGPTAGASMFDRRSNVRTVVLQKLIETLRERTDPSLQGAIAIALGLSRGPSAVVALQKTLESASHHAVLGHVALALALLGDRDSAPKLREHLQERGIPQAFRMDLIRALSLLHDPEFHGQLIETLRTAGNLGTAAAAAKGLGLVADRRAAPPLLTIFNDRKQPDLRRAFAAVALGLLAEKTDQPWNLVYSIDANYTVFHRPLSELLSIL